MSPHVENTLPSFAGAPLLHPGLSIALGDYSCLKEKKQCFPLFWRIIVGVVGQLYSADESLFWNSGNMSFWGSCGSAFWTLGYWSQGWRLKPQRHQAASAGPMSKALSPQKSSLLTDWEKAKRQFLLTRSLKYNKWVNKYCIRDYSPYGCVLNPDWGQQIKQSFRLCRGFLVNWWQTSTVVFE